MTIYKDLMPEGQRITRRPSHGHRTWFGSGLFVLSLGAAAYLGGKPAMSESNHAGVREVAAPFPQAPDQLFAPERWQKIRYPRQTPLWNYYMAEGVGHYVNLWQRYVPEIEKFNTEKDNKLDVLDRPPGWNTAKPAFIWLPDLDGDKKVGEAEIQDRK